MTARRTVTSSSTGIIFGIAWPKRIAQFMRSETELNKETDYPDLDSLVDNVPRKYYWMKMLAGLSGRNL